MTSFKDSVKYAATTGRAAVFFIVCASLFIGLFACSKGDNSTSVQQQPPAPQQQAAPPPAAVEPAKIQAPAPAPNPAKGHFDAATKLYKEKKYDEALKEYTETLKYDPQSAQTYSNMGFIYFDKKEYDNAIKSQKKALELDPKYGLATLGLAQSYEKKGKKKEAIKYWREVLKLVKPHSDDWMQVKKHINQLEGKPSTALGPAPTHPSADKSGGKQPTH